MRLLSWNVENTSPGPQVAAGLTSMLVGHHPDVITLQETYRLRPTLKRWAKQHGFVLVQRRPRRGDSERAEVAILVRKHLAIRKRRTIALRSIWRGPKAGVKHDGRRYRWVLVEEDGHWWRIGCLHQPFGQAPKAESIKRVQRWFDRAPRRASVMAGDWNMTKAVVEKRLKDVDVTGFGIDLSASRHCTVKATRLGKHGSDHHAIRYEVTR
ncbi:MAG TPA: endonuclease/exonuclease/phosphatase family protein [Marmoricola sp.]